jgi:hypothetical protein
MVVAPPVEYNGIAEKLYSLAIHCWYSEAYRGDGLYVILGFYRDDWPSLYTMLTITESE